MVFPRSSNFRLDTLFRAGSEPVFALDSELKLAFVNSAFESLVSRSSETLLGLPCGEEPNQPGDLEGSLRPPPEVLLGRRVQVRTRFKNPDSGEFPRDIEFQPYLDAKGRLIGILGLVLPPSSSTLPESNWQRIRSELLLARERAHDLFGIDSLIGEGPRHDRFMDQLTLASGSRVPILLVGEPGTGKNTVARAIHRQGVGRAGPLLPVDIETLPTDVLDRDLFGPHIDLIPKLHFPANATLILGDILLLPRDLQAKLAKALKYRDGTRLIATTSGDFELAFSSSRLREDLYHALSTLVLKLEPLRRRLPELPILAAHLLEKANRRANKKRAGFSQEALDVLLAYDWPGNLRELARVVDFAHESGDSVFIEPDHLPTGIRGHQAAAYLPTAEPPAEPLDRLLNTLERHLLEQALKKVRHNKSKAADLLGISRPRLYRRIKELDIPDVEEAPDDETVLET